ncbi:MAG: hypothetical protein OJF62_001888 [Pseudolabrys sp.]|jgi:3-phenylpropionate/cinnamic acid dioxygenase small subunit|nr:hypothetical protein [Pseudolabrys sp.]
MNQHAAIMQPDLSAWLQPAEQLLYLEADVLDRQMWEEWLPLYTEDSIYWVPSWADEEHLIENPELEINMMYIVGKAGLEARLYRISSRDSYASLPLPRTSHVVSSVRITGEAENGDILVSAKWSVLSSDARRGKIVRGGWYDYALAKTAEGLRIRRKKITLLEDMIDGTIDIFQI